MSKKPAVIYHATTPKKAKLYRQNGSIICPVRGFDTLQGAMAWAIKVNRTVIFEIQIPSIDNLHKLPDHHNHWGTAFWYDGNIDSALLKCVYSPEKA